MAGKSTREPATTLHEWQPELQKARVYEQILFDIVCGVLKAGSQLDETLLVARYRHGIAGIRDALGRLALEGLVQRRPRIGTTVAPLDLMEVQQVFEARILVEGHCAALAAEKASSADIVSIQSAFADVDRAIAARDHAGIARMDQVFHRAVAAASGNEPLAKTVVTLHNSAVRFWHYSLSRRPEAQLRLEIQLHRDVAAAIVARDPAGAARAMREVLGLFPDSMRHLLLGNLNAPASAATR